MCGKKDYIWNPDTSCYENCDYLASIIDDALIECDETIDAVAKSCCHETKIIPTNFNQKKVTCKRKNVYILRTFLLFTIALLIAVSIYFYRIKY